MFPIKPFKHQLECFELSKDKEEFAYFIEMGGGKSLIAIANMCYLYQQKKIVCALIIAPKGVIPSWYSERDGVLSGQIPEHMWTSALPCQVAVWTPDKTKKAQAAIDAVILPPKELAVDGRRPLRILLMNIEAISTKRGVLVAKDFLVQGPSITILDESTCIKNGSANRTKGVLWLAKFATYRRALTGMPVENRVEDLYYQCEFLKPGLLGHRSFYSFRNAYCNLVSITVPDKPRG